MDERNNQTPQSSMDDINALLASVGLDPVQPAQADPAAPAAEKTRHFTPVTAPQTPAADDKTKHFPLGGTAAANEPQATAADDKTRHFPLGGTTPPTAPTYMPAEEKSSQMLLDGYADDEAPRRVDEAQVEEQLQRSRKNLVENFRVFSGEGEDNAVIEKAATGDGAESVFDGLDVPEGETLFDAVARAKKGDKGRLSAFVKTVRSRVEQSQGKRADVLDAKTMRESLAAQKKTAKRGALAQLVLLGVSLLLSVFASIYLSGGAFAGLFDNGARIFTLVNLVLMAISAVFALPFLKAGVLSLMQKQLNADSLSVILSACAVLHGLLSLIIPMDESSGIVSFSGCMIFVLFLRSAGIFVRALSGRNDLSVMLRAKHLQGLFPASDPAVAASLCRGLTEKQNPQLLYTADTTLPQTFDETPAEPQRDEKAVRFAAIAAAGAALVFAVVNAVLQKNAVVFLPSLVSCVFLFAPYLRGMIFTLLKTKNDALLSVSGAVVSGARAAEAVGTADAIVLESEDVFDVRVNRFRTVPGGRMSSNDAALYAAAALHQSRSLLAGAFDKFLEDAGVRAPAAEDLQYEDQLGYACWIAGRRVLVGTREMLVQHSIPAPSAEEEEQYGRGRSVLYVVVEGLVAATFIAQYRVRREAKKCVRLFNKSGAILMLDSGDPSITEAYAAKRLSVNVAAIKILNLQDASLLQQARETPAKGNAGLFCAKGQHAAPQLVYAAHNLFEANRLAGVVHFAGLALCLLLLVLCVFLKVSMFFMPITVIFLQLLWSLIAYFIGATKLKSSSPLK